MICYVDDTYYVTSITYLHGEKIAVMLFDVDVEEYRVKVHMRNMDFLLAVCNEWTVKALLFDYG